MGISEGRIYWIYQRNVLYCNGNAFVFNSHTRVGSYSRILKSGFNLKLMLRGIGRRNLVSCFSSNIILLFVLSWKAVYIAHIGEMHQTDIQHWLYSLIQFLGMSSRCTIIVYGYLKLIRTIMECISRLTSYMADVHCLPSK